VTSLAKNCLPGPNGLVSAIESMLGVIVATVACIAMRAIGLIDPSPSTICPRSSLSGSRMMTAPPTLVTY
jgi:hypothetical protein